MFPLLKRSVFANAAAYLTGESDKEERSALPFNHLPWCRVMGKGEKASTPCTERLILDFLKLSASYSPKGVSTPFLASNRPCEDRIDEYFLGEAARKVCWKEP